MEDPTLRSNPLPEEQPAPGDAVASDEQAATPAEAEKAQAQPSEETAPEGAPSDPLAQAPAAPEAPVIPPSEEIEPEVPAAAQDNSAQTETPEAPAAPAETPAAPAAPAEPPKPRFSDLAPGMVMDGTVTRIEKYGAFVNLGLADRREGLIHISEMAPHRIRRVEDVVKVGDSVKARIVSIDTEKRRIGLSLNEIPDETGPQQPPAPQEPAKTAMQIAFEEARSRRNEEMEAARTQQGGAVGSRKKREQEELMKRLRSSE